MLFECLEISKCGYNVVFGRHEGGFMKNKLYYFLFLFYLLMVGVILFINGAFSGNITSYSNLFINVGFLVIIGILFLISMMSFGRLNRCTDALVAATKNIKKEAQEQKRCLWDSYRNREKVFEDKVLENAFLRYQNRIRGFQGRKGLSNTCDLEEYINEELLDKVGLSYYNSAISGTLTGLGILGTFLGLSMGLASFQGNDIYTISDNVGPLLEGMKVAFHTSVYGIFFSLLFNFVYRSIMSDAYSKLEEFLTTYREYVMPAAANTDENSQAMLIYQANMANSMKTMTELLRGNALEQTKGVERIVNQFAQQLTQVMGADFERLGRALNHTCELQEKSLGNYQGMAEVNRELQEINRSMQKALERNLERQEQFAQELAAQGEQLAVTCNNLSDEISNQLYTFEQMKEIYEK